VLLREFHYAIAGLGSLSVENLLHARQFGRVSNLLEKILALLLCVVLLLEHRQQLFILFLSKLLDLGLVRTYCGLHVAALRVFIVVVLDTQLAIAEIFVNVT
jgi:hypothetical protein